jgi:hypothetical protein
MIVRSFKTEGTERSRGREERLVKTSLRREKRRKAQETSTVFFGV